MWLVSKAPPSTVAGSSLVISNCLSGDDKLDNTLEKLGRVEVSGFLSEAYANLSYHDFFLGWKFKNFVLCFEKGYGAMSFHYVIMIYLEWAS